MKIAIPKTRAEMQHHLRDPLLKNSIFIMLTSITSAGFGFIFWMLAAKLYSPQDVGIATALISSMGLLVLLSRFGLDFSIIRFFPGADKSRIFSTSAIITTSFAVIFGAVFIAGVDIISPELGLLKSPRNAALFLIFLAASSVTALTAISFIAIRKAAFQFIQSIIVGSRILFLIPLIALGAIGIFGAVGISFVLALAAALALLVRSGVRPGLVVDRGFLDEAFHFSAGNYLAGLFVAAPNMILPIMVLNVLGAEQAAYYYIAFAIASLLFMIPNAISMSLFVEGSHGEALKRTVVKSLIVIFSLLVPAAVLLYLCGGWVLGMVGADYAAGGLEVLRVMVLASLFVGVNYGSGMRGWLRMGLGACAWE
jgi:O-antigen/teichoic acid export membrane protein